MIGKLDKVRGTGVSGPLRSVGRVALWAVVVLILLRGVASVVRGESHTDTTRSTGGGETSTAAQAVDAFAVRYVRTYLADSSPEALRGLLAGGVSVPAGGAANPTDTTVAQAEATATRVLGDGRRLVTVSCELVDGSVVFLAVPIARDSAGGVAALGAPAFVSAPGIGRVEGESERSLPIPGVDAEVRTLATRFVETYLSATNPADLEYLTAPAAEIAPVGGYEIVGSVGVRQLEGGGPRRRTVLALVHARSGAGATYPLSYRLQLEQRDRWYVAAVEGEVK